MKKKTNKKATTGDKTEQKSGKSTAAKEKKSRRKPVEELNDTEDMKSEEKALEKEEGAQLAFYDAVVEDTEPRGNYRAYCHTDGRKLTGWTTLEKVIQAQDAHESQFPSHATDYEER